MTDIVPISPSPVVPTVQKVNRDTRREGQSKQKQQPRPDMLVDQGAEEDSPKHIDERV